jgi:type I restriction enzyme S subunit
LSFFNSQIYTDQLNEQIHGGVNPNIHAENIKICKVVIPTIKEQIEIAAIAEKINTKIATAISLKEREIEKMKEYKMSLVDGVVTGKVKVC